VETSRRGRPTRTDLPARIIGLRIRQARTAAACLWIEAAPAYSESMFLIARIADFRASSSVTQSSGVTMLRMILPEFERPLGVTLARQRPGCR
jgi:hypothetical protein